MVYHSTFVEDEGITKACGCPLLPLKSHIRGPAPVSDQATNDIIDEAIMFFRANVFFKNFDIQSPADKLLIYLTFYINVALKRLEGCRTLAEGTKAVINLGLEDVPVPGESGFPFPGLFTLPGSKEEAVALVIAVEGAMHGKGRALSPGPRHKKLKKAVTKLFEASKGRNKWEIVERCVQTQRNSKQVVVGFR
ncbi:hypothetical protein R6Q59_033103 [Mikania micrantha]